MRVHVLMFLLYVFVTTTAVGASKRLFDVTLEDVQGGGRILNVSFYSKVPAPATVDKILRESLEHAVLVDPKTDILGMAFFGDGVLTHNQYSGELIYEASRKKIVTMDEHRGIKSVGASVGNYFAEVREERTLAGITPVRRWFELDIVYAKSPSQEVAYDAIMTEIGKLAGKGRDVTAYVNVGDKNVKTSWQQLRDKDGAYVFAEYDAASKELTRKGRLIQQLP